MVLAERILNPEDSTLYKNKFYFYNHNHFTRNSNCFQYQIHRTTFLNKQVSKILLFNMVVIILLQFQQVPTNEL